MAAEVGRRGWAARALRACALALLALSLGGCGFLPHIRHVAKAPLLPMKTATLEQLVASFNRETAGIHTLNVKSNLIASVGGARTGKVTDYPEVVAYLLVQAPDHIRLIGQFSLAGTIFDMASDGQTFQLSIPEKNQFITGHNNVIPPKVKNPLEKLRPQVILDALLIHPIVTPDTVALVGDDPYYQVLVLSPAQNGVQHVLRRISFSRYDLMPQRQTIYNPDGSIATLATYNQFQSVDGVLFPSQIVIERPEEQYSLSLNVQRVTLNAPLGTGKFHLQQPNGSRLVQLSQALKPTRGSADASLETESSGRR